MDAHNDRVLRRRLQEREALQIPGGLNLSLLPDV